MESITHFLVKCKVLHNFHTTLKQSNFLNFHSKVGAYY